MFEEDFDTLSAMLDDVAGLKGEAYTAGQRAMFFRALSNWSIDDIRAGLDAHVKDPQRGRFLPLPADVIAQMEKSTGPDSRPGPEEAWAMIPSDESQTVVWTAEMAEAYGSCSPLLVQGDRIGARMAFKEVYERLVSQSRTHGRPAVWQASLGHDIESRKRVLKAAVDAGRLTHQAASQAYPALDAPKVAALPAPEGSKGKAAEVRKVIQGLAQQKRADPIDPLKWAKDLRTSERGGLPLTAAQKTAWREALDQAPAQEVMGNFKPITNDLLPPGMRQS